ncbi:MAG: bifunctional oligoribonuclease/PAP phosphatase NrnA [Opitutales bacterium]|nr:bifunctional oligoribonuclease/PAP phosphatase NrnA [Opitutales bacterium]
MNNDLPNLRELLAPYPAYNIVGHVRPDGDCIGSAVALSCYLSKIGKRGYVIRTDAISSNFEYFFADVPTVNLENLNRDLPLICVDCSDRARIGEELGKLERPFLVIDHHKSNKGFAATDIIFPDIASTAEILAHLFEHIKFQLDKKMAEALYLGILTDTGRFAHNTTIDTFRYAQQMLQAGVDPSKIYSIVYENNSLCRYRLLERLLANIDLFSKNRACISHLLASDLAEVGGCPSDTEGFVNYTRELAGVLVGCYVEYHDTFVKCSMRSVDRSLRLDLLAEKLGGGGHACAVGFIADPQTFSLENLKEKIDSHINKFYDEYIAARKS